MATRCNLSLLCGETFNKVITIIDPSTGQPKDLTGYSATFVARAYWDSTATILNLYTGGGGITLGGTAGTITLYAASATTRAVDIPSLNQAKEILPIGKDPEGNLVYEEGFIADYQLEISSNGITERILEGKLVISPALKRS